MHRLEPGPCNRRRPLTHLATSTSPLSLVTRRSRGTSGRPLWSGGRRGGEGLNPGGAWTPTADRHSMQRLGGRLPNRSPRSPPHQSPSKPLAVRHASPQLVLCAPGVDHPGPSSAREAHAVTLQGGAAAKHGARWKAPSLLSTAPWASPWITPAGMKMHGASLAIAPNQPCPTASGDFLSSMLAMPPVPATPSRDIRM